eukprot:11458998-Karenia_brevis.AAC.1
MDRRPNAASQGMLSALEKRSVGADTEADYLKRITPFTHWILPHIFATIPISLLDALMCDYFDEMFFQGLPHADGSKLMAAVKFFRPE